MDITTTAVSVNEDAMAVSHADDRVENARHWACSLSNVATGLSEAEHHGVIIDSTWPTFIHVLDDIADELEEADRLLGSVLHPKVPKDADGPDTTEPSRA